jgi:hypothetical protein
MARLTRAVKDPVIGSRPSHQNTAQRIAAFCNPPRSGSRHSAIGFLRQGTRFGIIGSSLICDIATRTPVKTPHRYRAARPRPRRQR